MADSPRFLVFWEVQEFHSTPEHARASRARAQGCLLFADLGGLLHFRNQLLLLPLEPEPGGCARTPASVMRCVQRIALHASGGLMRSDMFMFRQRDDPAARTLLLTPRAHAAGSEGNTQRQGARARTSALGACAQQCRARGSGISAGRPTSRARSRARCASCCASPA